MPYPGLLGTFFIFFFGPFTCLIFACAQTSHGGNFPVNSIFMYLAVGLSKCSPVCPISMGLVYHSLDLHPINHNDPDGIILSNFMLALVVLNNSIIKPPSFHLPFICHPSFMAFVKLKRSWLSCRKIFTSHVSFAMNPSLCLQITSSFPL